jgi:hypothetical protein
MLAPAFSAKRRIVAVRWDGSLCVGPVFTADFSWYLQRVGAKDKLTRMSGQQLEIMDLAHPSC